MYEGPYSVAYEVCQTKNFEKKDGLVYLNEI